MNKIKTTALIISLLLFLLALSRECYLVNHKPSIGSFGLISFLLGWLNVSWSGISWLANPLLILSYIFLFKSEKWAIGFSLLALGFSLSFLFVDNILVNEAGHTGKITGYLSGYWFWVASICVVFIASIGTFFLNKNLN